MMHLQVLCEDRAEQAVAKLVQKLSVLCASTISALVGLLRGWSASENRAAID